MKSINLRISQAVSLFAIFTFVGALSGCVENSAPVMNTAQTSASPAAPASATNTNVTSPAPNPELARVPITLPMLDALLTDESAASELKTRAQLTDEQIQKLRDAGKNAVLDLGEGGDDAGRSTNTASKDALAKIREIVGEQKAESVANFLRERWTAGGETLAAGAPNSIPTDTRIVVNAPAYRMDIFREGKLAKSYKIGIGYPEFPLPSGLRRASEIIYNPTWTPPDEPWVKGKFAPGKKVDAGSKDNPLGPIKIPIGLPSLIHGGKSADRLGNFASHGCVGLTNGQVQDFAVELSAIGGQNITLNDVKAYQKDKTETKNVKLANNVPVELRYETIVVTDDGKLSIYRDVYERGTNTEENLRRVLDALGVSFETLPAMDQEKIKAALQQMASDAGGQPVNANADNTSTTANTAKTDKSNASNKSTSDKVTRSIKGKREVIFNLPQLKGKGYPVPVKLVSA